MNGDHFEELLNPGFVWGYHCKTKSAHFAPRLANSLVPNYQVLVHPDDIAGLKRLIRRALKKQRRNFMNSCQVVSVHRVKNACAEYRTHLSLFVIRRDSNNRPTSISGMDFPIPADAPISDAELKYLSKTIRNLVERLNPLATWLATLLRRGDTTIKSDDPFERNWRCGKFLVSPSRFRITKIRNGKQIEMSEKQARFIALLLGARASDGKPTYVERSITRTKLFGSDPSATVHDNDIDQIVKFFRKHLGRSAIRTKRGYGHMLGVQQIPA